MTCFKNSLHQVCSQSKDWKSSRIKNLRKYDEPTEYWADVILGDTNSPPAPIQCRPHVSGIAYIGYAHSHKIGNHHDLKVFGSAKTNDP